MPKPKPNRARPVPRKMHIYCEGEKTEPNYLQGYLDSLTDSALRGVIKIEDTNKNTPRQLVQEAVNSKNSGNYPDGDVFWVVYDRESKQKYPDRLHDEALTLAQDHGINIALSNVCFEQWIIFHFTNSDASYSSYDDLLSNSCLKNKIKEITGKQYDKGYKNIFNLVKNDISKAKKIALAINKRTLSSAPKGVTKAHLLNPYTDIPLLLNAIDNFGKTTTK